uniref:Uncharacterized protein n=2 Tax=Pan TaxID=9596 RepID=A0A2I3SL00_PANTR
KRRQLNKTNYTYSYTCNSVVYFIPLESYLLCFSAHRPSLLFYQYVGNQHSHP